MLKSIIRLRDDSEIGSGVGQDNAILSCTVTECVNNGSELTIGSVCSSCLEAQIIAKNGSLSLSPGDEGELYKEDETGARTRAGIFHLESPTKKSDNVYKITAFDRVSQLDKDLSVWLKELSDWPYALSKFASMVCAQCGLFCNTDAMLNADFPVPQFYKSGVTGRQLMQWVGEIAGCFCRATPEGEIELAWYTDSGVTVSSSGERYYFAGALTYEDYTVAAIDAVKLKLAESTSGALWPDGEANNPYTIAGNAILLADISEDLLPYLEVIQSRLSALPAYKPCKVSLPAGQDLHAGHTVSIVDRHGNQFTTLIMTKTQSGQRDTLECTGSQNRSSTTATNNKTTAQIAQQVVDSQTRQDIFNKLTDGGQIQGIYVQDGKWYINAELTKIINLIADHVLSRKDDYALEIDGASLQMTYDSVETAALQNYGSAAILYLHETENGKWVDGAELGPRYLKLGGTSTEPVLEINTAGGKAKLWLNGDEFGKTLSWKDNGDGTYTLIGT